MNASVFGAPVRARGVPRAGRRSLPGLIGAAALIAAGSCGGPTEPGSDAAASGGSASGSDSPRAIVSNPVDAVLRAQASRVVLSAMTGETRAYVSFVPGTFEGADSASVVNALTGERASGVLIDGGLDPVAIRATYGDTLDVTVFRKALPIVRLRKPVPRKRPPVVVRTRPTRGSTAVPLNSSILVVFSEPIDRASVTEGGVRLETAGQSVPVDIEFALDGTSIEIVSRQPLGEGSTYHLTITDDVRDLQGESLEATEEIAFTMALAESTVVYFDLDRDTATVAVGMTLQVPVHDGQGRPIPPGNLAWSSSNPAIARVAEPGVVVGVARGRAILTVASSNASVETSVEVVLNGGFQVITAGGSHTCALDALGKAACWGDNTYGQLGAPSAGASSALPVPVELDLQFTSISAGAHHTCAIDTSGRAWCWGRNEHDQVGDGTREDRDVPVVVSWRLVFASVSAGARHTCALAPSGDAYCWGDLTLLGAADAVKPDGEPAQVGGGDGPAFTSISAGADHTCAVGFDRTSYCWGDNGEGQLTSLGAGSFSRVPIPPDPVWNELRDLTDVATGPATSCYLGRDGSAWCGGARVVEAIEGGGLTLLCDEGRVNCPWLIYPFPPEGMALFAALSAGGGHACGVTTSGQIYCWGRGDYGQRGDDRSYAWTYMDPPVFPVVGGASSFSTVAAGDEHTCALTSTGEAYCWGRNDRGQLGDGTFVSRSVATKVGG